MVMIMMKMIIMPIIIIIMIKKYMIQCIQKRGFKFPNRKFRSYLRKIEKREIKLL